MQAFNCVTFLFSGSRPGQTRDPILASDTSKRVLWPKEVPFGVQEDKYFIFHTQNRQKPQFWGTFNASGSRPGQTRGPILASDTSKRVFWPVEVPFVVQIDKYFSFHPKNRQKPQFWGTFNAFPMENKNANNF